MCIYKSVIRYNIQFPSCKSMILRIYERTILTIHRGFLIAMEIQLIEL